MKTYQYIIAWIALFISGLILTASYTWPTLADSTMIPSLTAIRCLGIFLVFFCLYVLGDYHWAIIAGWIRKIPLWFKKITPKHLNAKVFALLLIFLLVVVPLVSMGATWVRNAGLLPGTAVVFGDDVDNIDKFMATIFHGIYGDRCGLGDGLEDDVQINAAFSALLAGGGSVILRESDYDLVCGIEGVANSVLEGQGVNTILTVHDAYNSLLTLDAAAAQPDVTVADASGFRVGQEVGIADALNDEEGIVASIAGNTVTLEENLANNYTVANAAHLFTAINAVRTAHEVEDDVGINSFSIKNLKIDGNKANQQTALSHGFRLNGIAISDSEDCLVENVEVVDSCCHGLWIYGGRRHIVNNFKGSGCGGGMAETSTINMHWHMTLNEQVEDCWLTNLYLYDNYTWGIYVSGVVDTAYKNFLVDTVTNTGHVNSAGVYVYEGDAALGSRNITLEDGEILNALRGAHVRKNCYHTKLCRITFDDLVGTNQWDAPLYIASSYTIAERIRILSIPAATSGIIVRPETGDTVTDVEILNAYVYSDHRREVYVTAQWDTVTDVKILGGYFINGAPNILFDYADYCSVIGATITESYEVGICANNGADGTIIADCRVFDNNSNNFASLPGILLSDSQDCVVTGNHCYDSGVGTQDYGIRERIVGGTCDHNTIVGNNCHDNTDGQIQLVGEATLCKNNTGAGANEERLVVRMKNTSGGALAAGDVGILKNVAAGDEVTTTVVLGDDLVFGMAVEAINNNAYGPFLVEGKTALLNFSNDQGAVAVGDFLCTNNVATEAALAGAGDMAFAIALEASALDAVLDALLIVPRKL